MAYRRIDVDLPRVYEVEGAAQGLNHGFFDGPEQGRGPGQISTRQPQGMVQLRSMEDPVYGVFSLEFMGCGHIDADIRLIPTEGGPIFPPPALQEMAGPRFFPNRSWGRPSWSWTTWIGTAARLAT